MIGARLVAGLALLAAALLPPRAGAQDPLPPVVAEAVPDSGVSFHALVTPSRVYVGQQAMYQIAVFVSDQLRGKLRRNPEYIPPELRGLLAYDVRNGYRLLENHVANGTRYEVHLFQRAVFPLAAGTLVIPPARLVYAVPLGSSFFSREESRTLRSRAVSLEVIEPPRAGRPDDWRGAVGRFSLSAALDAREPRVGDPLRVTVRVSGEGNVSLLPRPRLAIPWGTVVTADERVRVDSSAAVVSGTKEFDWIVTPTRAGDATIDPLRYPYWNPHTEAWEVAVTAPESLRVRAGTLAGRPDVERAERARLLPLRREYRGALPTPLSSREPFWLLLLVAPVPALAVGALGRRGAHRSAAAPLAPRRRLEALAKQGSEDAALVRRAFLGALADRLGIPTATLTSGDALRRAMRRAGVADATARETVAFVAMLDAAAYAGGDAPRSADARAAASLFERISSEARVVTSASAIRPLVALLLLAGAAATAVAAPPDRERFDAGVRMYEAGRFGDAVRAFADVSREVPRAADAWANLGTAAWLAGDTAAAAVGWQRALRLEPRAGDVRHRLDLLPAGQEGSIAGVPSLPADWVLLPAGVAWLVTWCAIAWIIRRPRDGRAVTLLVLATVSAAGLGLVGQGIANRLAARDLAVLREDLALRAVPALGGEESASAVVGDVARVERREGGWARVALDGGRGGWVEADRLVGLADD